MKTLKKKIINIKIWITILEAARVVHTHLRPVHTPMIDYSLVIRNNRLTPPFRRYIGQRIYINKYININLDIRRASFSRLCP